MLSAFHLHRNTLWPPNLVSVYQTTNHPWPGKKPDWRHCLGQGGGMNPADSWSLGGDGFWARSDSWTASTRARAGPISMHPTPTAGHGPAPGRAQNSRGSVWTERAGSWRRGLLVSAAPGCEHLSSEGSLLVQARVSVASGVREDHRPHCMVPGSHLGWLGEGRWRHGTLGGFSSETAWAVLHLCLR